MFVCCEIKRKIGFELIEGIGQLTHIEFDFFFLLMITILFIKMGFFNFNFVVCCYLSRAQLIVKLLFVSLTIVQSLDRNT